MRFRAASLRPSSREQYLRTFWRLVGQWFQLGILFPPSSAEQWEFYAAWAVSAAGLQGSTVDQYISAVSEWFAALRSTGLPAINPARFPGMGPVRKTLRKRYKTPSQAKMHFELPTLRRVFAAGYSPAGLSSAWASSYSDGRIFAEASRLRMLRPLLIPAQGPVRLAIRRNWHARLSLTLLCFGMLRKNVLERLRVTYTVCHGRVLWGADSDIQVRWSYDACQPYLAIRVPGDKNLEGVRWAAIPACIPGVGLSPVEEFCAFVRASLAPPSGDFFFRAPTGHRTQFVLLKEDTERGYASFPSLVKRMYTRAFPAAVDAALYASHSGRKTLAQLLNAAGFPLRLIADTGGWALNKAAAVHAYFSTSVLSILRAVSSIGCGAPGLRP